MRRSAIAKGLDLARQGRALFSQRGGVAVHATARIELGEAETANDRLRWSDAMRFAGQAAALDGGAEETFQAKMLQAVAMIESGSVEAGTAAGRDAIRGSTEKSLPYVAASGELSLAEAL
jgi:cytochrome c551/c552